MKKTISESPARPSDHTLMSRFLAKHLMLSDGLLKTVRLGLLLMMVQALGVPASCQPAIAYDQPTSGSITQALQRNIYTFAAVAGEKLAVGVQRTSGSLYPTIEIHGPGDVLLARNYGSSWVAIDPFSCTNAGAYTVWVYDDNSTGTGTYTIIRQPRSNYADVLPLGYDQPVSRTITNWLKVDAFSVTLTNGEKLAVGVLKNSGSLYPTIEIRGPSGVLLARNYGSSWVAIDPFSCTNAGAYTVWVYDDNSTGTGTYTIIRQPRSNYADVLPLGYDQPVSRTITNWLKVDAFSVTLTNGEKLAVGVLKNSGSLYPTIEIRGPSGVLLARNYGSSWVAIDPFSCTNAGAYTICVYDDNSTGTGTYTIIRQPRNGFSDVVDIGCQTSARTITNMLKVDVFRFTAGAGEELGVGVQKTSGPLYPTIEIHGPGDVLLARNYGSSWVEINPFTCTNAGAYTIWVYDDNSTGTGTYSITLTVNWPGSPAIISPPTNQTVQVSSSATFCVVAQGSCLGNFPLGYQWRLNGSDLSNGGRISGATTACLTISNAQTSDQGGYTVVVSNLGGAVTSAPPAMLTVTDAPVITTPSPLPAGVVGTPYSQTLEAAGGRLPYAWSVVSGSLPPGLTLAANTGTISGTPTAANTYTFGVRVTGANGLFSDRGFSLTINAALQTLVATHFTSGYFSPGTNTVACQISYPVGRQLYLLMWTPQLPGGWSLLSASGDGNPEVNGGNIVFMGFSLTSPLNFSYSVGVPANQTGTNFIRGTVSYLFDGMTDTAEIMATPDPLPLAPIRYHSADYQDPRWVIDNVEVSWVLAYWRAQALHLQPNGRDGYAVGVGNTNGPRHSADYREPYWVLDGSEMNRVLSYWRAGGYHPDSTGVDGYAPGKLQGGNIVVHKPMDLSPDITVTQDGPSIYVPGQIYQVTNTIEYTRPLASLLLRPRLPSGWTLQSVSGAGNPEAVAGDILWTGTIPPSPFEMLYTAQVPPGARAVQQLRGEVEYQTAEMVNPAVCYALPDPLTLSTIKLTPPVAQAGQIEFGVNGEAGRSYKIQTSSNLVDWVDVTTVMISGGSTLVRQEISGPTQFYRAVLVP